VNKSRRRTVKISHRCACQGAAGGVRSMRVATGIGVLRPGSTDGNSQNSVSPVQSRLVELFYLPNSASVDGTYGRATGAAVTQFQRNNNLQVDGLVGQQTSRALFENTVRDAHGNLRSPPPNDGQAPPQATPPSPPANTNGQGRGQAPPVVINNNSSGVGLAAPTGAPASSANPQGGGLRQAIMDALSGAGGQNSPVAPSGGPSSSGVCGDGYETARAWGYLI